MSTRKIKDAKDLSTNELIYFKGHAQATYMSDGRTVEEAITSSTGGSGSTIDTSNLATKDELAQKQDIITDIDTIRSNAANYKYTVTSIVINNSPKIPLEGKIDLGYVNKRLITQATASMTLQPNVYYRNTSTTLRALTINLATTNISNIINEYFVEFTTSSSGTTVTITPSNIKWANGEVPTFEAGTTYQISIVNNLGVVTKFK